MPGEIEVVRLYGAAGGSPPASEYLLTDTADLWLALYEDESTYGVEEYPIPPIGVGTRFSWWVVLGFRVKTADDMDTFRLWFPNANLWAASVECRIAVGDAYARSEDTEGGQTEGEYGKELKRANYGANNLIDIGASGGPDDPYVKYARDLNTEANALLVDGGFAMSDGVGTYNTHFVVVQTEWLAGSEMGMFYLPYKFKWAVH